MIGHIQTMTLPELEALTIEAGQAKFRAGQLYRWLKKDGVSSYDNMGNLPKAFREWLAERYPLCTCDIEQKQVSRIDGTVKYLFRLFDGAYIESVLMQYKYGYTLCISTQVGCKMGCTFCASTIGGCVRNLEPAEMLQQIFAAQRDMDIRISHVVLMGMGEPLDNYENVLAFLRLATEADGLNLSMRGISLSTCGVVPKIYDLMAENLQLTLSVSLHAPNDAIRNQMMPVNRKWDIDTLLKACRDYAAHTNRRISFEYTMVEGVNDSDACAQELAHRLKGMLCHVNLIPVNTVRETNYQKTTAQNILRFQHRLQGLGINATVRRSLGGDIDASCGQLRQKAQGKR